MLFFKAQQPILPPVKGALSNYAIGTVKREEILQASCSYFAPILWNTPNCEKSLFKAVTVFVILLTTHKHRLCVPWSHKKVGEMKTLLPDEIRALLQRYYTCEFTTVNSKGQPVTWPCLTHLHEATGQIIATASIAFPVKAQNARRYPQVSLLYSDPSGSGLVAPPAILVQGDARVEELLDHTDPTIIDLYRVIQQRQPDNRRFMRNRLMRRIFTWYLFQRLLVTVTPQRVRLWEHGDFHGEATEVEVRHVE